ncbi:NAD(P)-binding domain-containing protein [Fibrella sp. HMF5335]|uniref:NAD(P)-binding domain-containing protein n=1 Tax=Fibrella rubiginis TaxID=2817060 RepID=A0A939GHD5_9BACT|nr:NAD(P)-binding domain-containing protein [Fibrella rubiginis]MBO0939064.1 NAD(P)-binding domain-containing protein [Fibrella rubiginis]
MHIAVLGTGMVGETIASRLLEVGHTVVMGSRSATNEKAAAWVDKAGAGASQGTFADAIAAGELIMLATKGETGIEAIASAPAQAVAGKTIIDISNPLDFSKGMPPTLSTVNDDSFGEKLQRAFPDAHVVKTLNTMWCGLMVNPAMLADGDHTVFMSGNDAGAKTQAKRILTQFGWQDSAVLDLGDITTARGTEMLLPLWLRIYGALGIGAFNFKVVKP